MPSRLTSTSGDRDRELTSTVQVRNKPSSTPRGSKHTARVIRTCTETGVKTTHRVPEAFGIVVLYKINQKDDSHLKLLRDASEPPRNPKLSARAGFCFAPWITGAGKLPDGNQFACSRTHGFTKFPQRPPVEPLPGLMGASSLLTGTLTRCGALICSGAL